LGIFFFFLFFPALLGIYGGGIGLGVGGIFRSVLGTAGAFLIILGLTIVVSLVAFNTSFSNIFIKIKGKSSIPPVKVNEPKASVYTTLGNKKVSPAQTQLPTISADGTWQYPPLDLLSFSSTKATSGNITKNVEIIQKTLKDFTIDVGMGDVNIGPTVTQYTLKPTEGVKLAAITARANDLSLALAAHPIRIEAPIPGKSAVGIEVPNKVAAIVTLREILETPEYKTSKSNLTLALGRDVAGQPIIVDLEKMPHLLIAGATGSGKSIGLNAIMTTLLFRNSPQDLRILLVDPKRVEFTHYNGLAHLLAPVVTDVDKTVNVLRWSIAEMERRFRLFQETHHRDIGEYNQAKPNEKIPYIVIVIDELADLMAQAANEVEGAIVRLAQMARATGIHLVVATQRPSVDVITGLIKANITSRVAFAVASQVDSRTILDMAGAEKLLGNGDMLYLGADLGKPKRIQGAMITANEIKAVTDFLKTSGQAVYDESILNFRPVAKHGLGSEEMIDDAIYEEAKQIVIQSRKASASWLQRRLRIGYARAARLLDMMEQEGIIGPTEGAKPRDILIDEAESTYYDQGPPQ
jgi:S-DNA-T family DNA segregation ATPase FtsK/SpoIIIE